MNTQRGSGVFDKSIQALLMLNQLGYGKDDSKLRLDLVYNPLGKNLLSEFRDLNNIVIHMKSLTVEQVNILLMNERKQSDEERLNIFHSKK